MLINEQGAIVEYVAQNPNNGQTVIKSVYKKPNKEIGELNIKGILDGRTHSSPAPSYQDINNHIQTTRPAAARFSALQDTMHNHITPINNGVNSSGWENLEKNFEDTSSVGYVAQNKFMPQNNLGQAGDLSQNPYSHILQSKRDKEDFDYYYNQLWKGLNQQDAQDDRLHDKRIQMAKRRLYSNSERACRPYRVRGINEKY